MEPKYRSQTVLLNPLKTDYKDLNKRENDFIIIPTEVYIKGSCPRLCDSHHRGDGETVQDAEQFRGGHQQTPGGQHYGGHTGGVTRVKLGVTRTTSNYFLFFPSLIGNHGMTKEIFSFNYQNVST